MPPGTSPPRGMTRSTSYSPPTSSPPPQCDPLAGPGPLDMAVIPLHRHDRLHEIGRVAADVDALADSERLMERDGRHREMGEVVRDRADRVGRVVVLAHGKPP